MADKPHLRLANHTDVANDDPFAELTRIMGFDPRTAGRPAGQPESGQAQAAVPAHTPAHDDTFDELDFSIDLEKELLGDLADDETFRSEPASAEWSDRAPRAEPVFQSYEPEAPVAADPFLGQPVAAADDAGWLGDVARHTQASELDDLDAEMEQAFDLGAFEADEPRAPPPAANDIPLPAVEYEPSFDDEVFSDLDFAAEETPEPSLDLPPQVPVRDIGDHTSELYAAGPLEFEPAATQESGFEDQFETAFSDVDLRFDAEEDGAGEQNQPVASNADLDRELDLSLDDGFADTLASEQQPVQAVAQEMSLEEELNALLGNSAPARATPMRAEMAAAPAAYSAPVQAAPVAYSAPAPVAEPVAYDQVGHTDGGWDAAPVPAYEPDRSAMVAAQPAPQAGFDDRDLSPAAHHAEPDFHLDFDDAEFDQALSMSAAPEQGLVAPQHVARHQEPVAAPVQPEEPVQAAADAINPYAALAALSATLKPSRSYAADGPREEPVAQHQQPAARDSDFAPSFADADGKLQPVDAVSDAYVPDIDTYDVPEHAVALADDLDLPEFAYEDEPAPAPAYDDIDSEFTSLLNGMNSADVPASVAAAAAPREERIDLSRHGADRDGPAIFAGVPYPAPSAPPAAPQVRPAEPSWNAAAAGQGMDDVYSDMRPAQPAGKAADQDIADMEFAYDPDLDEDIALPAYAPIEQKASPRRGMMIAAVVGGVALLGGAGALALSWGGGTGATGPVLVKADDQPVKVKPENPGGTTIPNQDNKVYDTVAGGSAPVDPKQDTLVSTAEEPVDIPPPMDESADLAEADAAAVPPSQKAEDRIEQAAEDAGVDKSMEVAAVAPRKVRTMIVKADGTLVAREDPAPVAEQPADDATAVMTAPAPTAAPTSTGTVDAAEPTDVASAPAAEESLPIATQPLEEPALAPASEPATEAAVPAKPAAEQSSVTPNKAPVAPARPADQPVNVVGEVKADKVAALSPAAAAPSGAWAMQIASQPTEEAANASYQDLARRYGSVLQGKQVNVVKAEIAGKGTFWRVRVAAGSRNEAVSLCESYKAAGGNCFVSK